MVDHLRLSRAAAEAGPLAEANKVRTALLAAVGHDFRTPLAAAKAAVSSLLSLDIRLDAEDRHELLEAADTSLDRLAALVDNLLDMSRLHAGRHVDRRAAHRGRRGHLRAPSTTSAPTVRIVVDTPDDLPLVQADPGLLERVLANVASNALRYSPPETPPHLSSSRLG